jgi:hypothetical protein
MNTLTKRILQTVSFAGLVLSIVPALMMFGGSLSREKYLHLMVLGMVFWFGTAVFWVGRDRRDG